MVQVSVDRPLREDDVWTLSQQDAAERFDSLGIHRGGAVDLASKYRFRTEDLARGLALGRPDSARLVVRLAGDARFTTRQINDGDFISERSLSRQCPAASRLGVVRMASGANDFLRSGLSRLAPGEQGRGEREDLTA